MTRHRLFAPIALLALSILAAPAFAGGAGWSHDVEASLAKAKSEGKHVLMDFTGSDWCGWCIKLNKEVFSHDEFKNAAPNDFVLVELDFPQDKSKLTEETIAQNKMWQEKLGIRGFPSIVLLTADGSAYAKTGYRPGGPDAYVTHLQELKALKADGDKLAAAAEKAEGIEQAKLYDQLLDMSEQGLIVDDADAKMTAIIAADADNAAGLKGKYEGKQALQRVQELMQKGPAAKDEILKAIDDAFAAIKPTGQVAQDLHMAKAQVLFQSDRDAALAEINAAIAAFPDGPNTDRIKAIKAQAFPDAK